MTCGYCRYLNTDEANRCRRCGRPLLDAYAMANSGSLAAVPRSWPHEPVSFGVSVPPAGGAGAARQALLFQEKPSGKVIPFEALAMPGFEPPAAKPKTATRTATRVRERRPPVTEVQPSLDFLPPAPHAARKLDTNVEAAIYCDAVAASPTHRAFSAAIDGSMIVIACGLFLTTFHLLGGALAADKVTLGILGAAAFLIAMFYGFVWVWSGGDTPGMRATRLTLIDFDGHPADRIARWRRFLGSCLSYCGCGLGILWVLVDEESLAWHDHISQTFPTFRGPESNFVRRR
jgi:uncharacterized RDD family membrane protein YckC